MAAFKELDVRSTSSIVRLIHSESIIIDSVDDDMAADLLTIAYLWFHHDTIYMFHARAASFFLLALQIWFILRVIPF